MPDQLACRLDLCCALGQAETHRLVVEDRCAKALALLGVADGAVQRAARHAHALRGDADAPAFESTKRDAVSRTLGANQVFLRNAAVVEVDLCRVGGMLAELVFDARHHITGCAGGNQKSAHATLAGALVGDRNHDRHIAVLAAGDELFDAVEHIAVAVLHRCRAQGRGVGADMRLGQTKRTQHPALCQRLEPLVLLRQVAVAHQNRVDRAVRDADRGAGAAITGGNFFQHQRQRQVVEIGATKFLGHTNTVGAERRQPLVRLLGKAVLLVPACGVGPQLGLGKCAHRVADHFLVLG